MAFKRKGNPIHLAIKPFKVLPELPANYEISVWKKLEAFIDAVFESKNSLFISKQDLYNGVEELVLHHRSVNLLQNLIEKYRTYIAKRLSAITEEQLWSINLLWLVYSIWTDYLDATGSIRQIFLPLDRLFIINTEDQSMDNIEISLFGRIFCDYSMVKKQLMEWIIVAITEERDKVTREGMGDILKTLVDMLLSIKIYESEFEKMLLNATDAYYLNDSYLMSLRCNQSEYVEHVAGRLFEEEHRIHLYLSETSSVPLLESVRSNLITRLSDWLLEPYYLKQMIREHNEKKIVMLSNLVQQSGIAEQFETHFSACTETLGTELLDEENDGEGSCIENILELRNWIDNMLNMFFDNREAFNSSIKHTWWKILNDPRNVNRITELLADYCDAILQNGSAYNSRMLRAKLGIAMKLFRMMDRKDYFEQCHRRNLYKRLFSPKVWNNEAEHLMASLLNEECGAEFTETLYKILKDVSDSNDMQKLFVTDTYCQMRLQLSKIKFQVLTCSETIFSDLKNNAFAFSPPIVRQLEDVYTDYYKTKFNSRTLKWQSNLGTATLLMHFPHPPTQDGRVPTDGSTSTTSKDVATYRLHASHPQAICLLAFNDNAEHTIDELHHSTGIGGDEIRELLLPYLVDRSFLGLRRSSLKPDQDVLYVNTTFHSNEYHIEKPIIQIGSTLSSKTDDGFHNNARFQDKAILIDAAIVSIMKRNVWLDPSQLIMSVQSRLRFHTTVSDVQERINVLVEKTFIQLVGSSYNYVS